MNILQTIAAEEKARLTEKRAIPDFQPGDTLRVMVKIKEGERERIQAFEGVCIARAGGGINENFTVRKISFGEGVERVFPLYSPNIDSIEVVRKGAVRRAKLYYLRGRTGKSARIAERRDNLLRKELAWLRRGPPARTSKPKFRIDAANALVADEPPARDGVELMRFATTRLGKDVVDLIDARISVGDRVLLDHVTWRLAPGERTGIEPQGF